MKIMNTNHSIEGVPFKERLMYGFGDAAQNVFLTVSMMFISIFYTDVFGLSPAFVGTLFLCARLVDSISDPMVGMLTDKWVGRIGRYRTWMLYAALPYSASLLLVFWAPELSENMKKVYAVITYIFLIVTNSCYAVPYISLNGVITSNPQERIDINVIRLPLAKVGGLICTLLIPILMGYFSSAKTAYRVSMSIMSIVVFTLALLCVLGTRERVTEHEKAHGEKGIEKERKEKYSVQKIGILKTIQALWENDQARILCGYALTVFIGIAMRSGATAYYVLYYLNSGEYWLSAMLTSGTFISMFPPFFTGWLLKKKICNSRSILIWSQFISALFCLAGYLISQDEIIIAFVLSNLIVFSLACQDIVVWSAAGNCADYGTIQYNKSVRGVINAALIFCLKFGMAIGGALIGFILSIYGYIGGENVNSEQLNAILHINYGVPMVFFILSGLMGYGWKLTPEYMLEIRGSNKKELVNI